jgi:5-formyltetrahydrofolate cyclo-ligase
MEAKRLLRSRLLSARASMPPELRGRAGPALADHGVAIWSAVQTVAAYAGVGTEPPTRELIDRLAERGVRVLLPVVDGDSLGWAPYAGWEQLVEAPSYGLLEPAGPRMGSDAVRAADVVLVPALAVDRAGHRLGRGGGFYDRAFATSTSRLVAVVYDDEVLDDLPFEPHDLVVAAALCPDGLVDLTGG